MYASASFLESVCWEPVWWCVLCSALMLIVSYLFACMCMLLQTMQMEGHNSARERHLLASAQSATERKHTEVVDECFFSGYVERVCTSTPLLAAPAENASSAAASTVAVKGPKVAHANQFSACMDSLKPLMQKQLNVFCDTVYDGECSMDGFYQPKLPAGRNGHFIGSAMFKYPWYFLQMPDTGEWVGYRQWPDHTILNYTILYYTLLHHVCYIFFFILPM